MVNFAKVSIYDTLNCNFYDFTTFRFTAFGFGDTIINPIGNFKELSQDIFLNSINLIVRVTATFDEQTGIIKWNFTSLEPNNMNFPDDPMRGFLPPNINSPEGEGFVSFYVNLKSLNHDDTIKNNATIIFDANEPVITNTYTNKIDIIIPESNMLPLNSTTSDTIISLSWTGNDIGSGIKFFSVYVSINDSDYVPIIQNTSLTETIYKVEHGKNYKFYSIAIDSVNNIEDIPQTYDTQITVDTLNIFNTIFELSNIYIYPNPVKDELNISFTIPNSQNITIKLFNILSKEVKILSDNIYPKGKYNLTFNISNINSGIYFISVISNNTTITKKLFIYK